MFSFQFFSVLDAAGKINAGVFNGNLAAYGNFEECMDIETEAQNISFSIQNQGYDFEVPAFKGWFRLKSFTM